MTNFCLASLASVAVLAFLVPLTSATPLGQVIEPVVSLDKMEPYHACLFICGMCFTEPEDEKMFVDCGNKVCGSMVEDQCAMEKFIWLGHHCRNYNMVESMWKGYKSKRVSLA